MGRRLQHLMRQGDYSSTIGRNFKAHQHQQNHHRSAHSIPTPVNPTSSHLCVEHLIQYLTLPNSMPSTASFQGVIFKLSLGFIPPHVCSYSPRSLPSSTPTMASLEGTSLELQPPLSSPSHKAVPPRSTRMGTSCLAHGYTRNQVSVQYMSQNGASPS